MEITTGIDIIDIERLETVIRRYSERFIKRIFTEKEIEQLPETDRAYYIATSFSFKEAIWKALPDEQQKEFYFRDIEIIWNKGTPHPVLKGRKDIQGLILNFSTIGKSVITTAILCR